MDIPLTLRLQKGARLLNREMDDNLVALRSAILALSGGLTITGVEQDDARVRFVYSDGSKSGQLVLPQATFTARGVWQSGEIYHAGDFVTHERNAYGVTRMHQASTFSVDLAEGDLVLFLEGGQDGEDGTGVEYPEADDKLYGVRNRQAVEIPVDANAIVFPADGGIYAVKNNTAIDITNVLGGGGGGGVEEAPNDAKSYVRKSQGWVELTHPEASGGTGGSGDGWVYQTVTILKGNVENGVTYGTFISHVDVVWKGGARVLVSSKAAAVSGRSVQLYAGSDQLLSANLDGTGVSKTVPSDLTIPASTPVDVRILGGSATLSGPITVRLAFKLAA